VLARDASPRNCQIAGSNTADGQYGARFVGDYSSCP
jgi:hypothetical protein